MKQAEMVASLAVCLMLRSLDARAATDELPDPPTLRSENGMLSVQLSAAPAPIVIGNRRFVFHCHVVKHEDKGMMQTIEVVRKP